MKSNFINKRSTKKTGTKDYWEAFSNHLDTIYFPGASELLDRKLIAFEYDAFKNYHTS